MPTTSRGACRTALTKERLLGLGWLLGFGVIIAISVYVTTFIERLPIAVAPLVFLVGSAINTVLWLWTSWVLPNRRAPGACCCPPPRSAASRSRP